MTKCLRISAVLAAAGIGGYWVYELLRESGPEPTYSLEVLFRSARGLREGAQVRYRGIPVGTEKTWVS